MDEDGGIGRSGEVKRMKRSIYQMICDHMKEGILDPAFSLPEEDADPSMPSFAPGALDGIMVYHMGFEPLNAAQAKQMARAVRAAAAGRQEEAEQLFEVWTKDVRAVRGVDALQQYVARHANQLDPQNVYETARRMVLRSCDPECVKVGLELLEMLSAPDEEIRTIIRRLGLCEDFSLCAVWNMRKWEDADRELFDLAKKVRGWGRIHAVEALETDDPEIRRWLLLEGWQNEIMPAYSALTCWEKSGAAEILANGPSPEEYSGIAGLIDGLLDEGPVPGISQVENAQEVLRRFLAVTPDLSRGIEGYEVVLHICGRAQDPEDPWPEIREACDALLHSEECLAAVRAAVREGEGYELAEALEIPFSPEGFSLRPPLQIGGDEE